MAERTDSLHIPGYSLIQDKETFCFGIDAVLLADFAFKNSLKGASKGALSVFDLGTGNGIIPVLLAAKAKAALKSVHITGLEIQEKMADMARRSVKLNGLEKEISILTGDIKEIPEKMEQGCADIVVSNPPYMVPQNSRQSSNTAKMTARQELLCTLSHVVKGAAWLLKKKNEGNCETGFYMIHRPQRLKEILSVLQENGFKRIVYRNVKPFAEKEETMVLIFASFDDNITIQNLPPLVVYQKPGEYTAEVKEIYGRTD